MWTSQQGHTLDLGSKTAGSNGKQKSAVWLLKGNKETSWVTPRLVTWL